MGHYAPTPAMVIAAETWAAGDQDGWESCGVFFYPDRRFGQSASFLPTVSQFIELTNTHQPEHERATRYRWYADELARKITRAYGTTPGGFVQLWHTHLTPERPSPEDIAAIRELEAHLAKVPLWGATPNHWIHYPNASPDAPQHERWFSYQAPMLAAVGQPSPHWPHRV